MSRTRTRDASQDGAMQQDRQMRQEQRQAEVEDGTMEQRREMRQEQRQQAVPEAATTTVTP